MMQVHIRAAVIFGAGLIRQMFADKIQRGRAIHAAVEFIEINQGRKQSDIQNDRQEDDE